MKKLTEMGECLRTIRSQRSMTQTVMAEKLGVSSAFLSYVEVGVKLPPKTWKDTIPEMFELTKTETKDFVEKFNMTVDVNYKIEKMVMPNKARNDILKLLLNNDIPDEVFVKVKRLIDSKDESVY